VRRLVQPVSKQRDPLVALRLDGQAKLLLSFSLDPRKEPERVRSRGFLPCIGQEALVKCLCCV